MPTRRHRDRSILQLPKSFRAVRQASPDKRRCRHKYYANAQCEEDAGPVNEECLRNYFPRVCSYETVHLKDETFQHTSSRRQTHVALEDLSLIHI